MFVIAIAVLCCVCTCTNVYSMRACNFCHMKGRNILAKMFQKAAIQSMNKKTACRKFQQQIHNQINNLAFYPLLRCRTLVIRVEIMLDSEIKSCGLLFSLNRKDMLKKHILNLLHEKVAHKFQKCTQNIEWKNVATKIIF